MVASGTSGPSILLVEDSRTMASAIAAGLLQNGFTRPVRLSTSAEDAWECLQTEAFDLVLLDLVLPGRSGLQLLADIRASDGHRTIPVVIFSSSTEPDEVQQAYALGANCFVRKPRRMSDFDETLAAVHRFWLGLAALPSIAAPGDAVVIPLSASATGPGTARRAARRALERWSAAAEVVDDVMLCLSELVTNGLIHGEPPLVVIVERVGPRVRIEVSDESPDHPQRRDASMDGEGGRGIAIVDVVASAWGITPLGSGKTVWAEIAT